MVFFLVWFRETITRKPLGSRFSFPIRFMYVMNFFRSYDDHHKFLSKLKKEKIHTPFEILTTTDGSVTVTRMDVKNNYEKKSGHFEFCPK